MSINRATILGHLGADPETRYTGNGSAVCSMRIATSEKWRDKQTGELQEHTEWHSVTAFGRTAEVAAEYLHKGSQVFIEGRIRTEKYTDKEGVERYSTKIIADSLQLLGGRQERGGSESQQQRSPARQSHGERTSANNHGSTRGKSRQAPPADDFEDDIPF